MRVFLAGGSGVIGRRLIPQLLDAGHEVIAMTRTPAQFAALLELGASAVVVDAFNTHGVRRAVAEAAPDVVVNQLTALRPPPGGRGAPDMSANDAVRREGTRALLLGAVESGARHFVAQSVAFWYVPGDGLATEETPLWEAAPEPIGPSVQTIRRMEESVLSDVGLSGVVLRYGLLYGPGTRYSAGGEIGEAVRRRAYPIIGKGRGVHSFVHVDDAAAATVAALAAPAGRIYNVTDDEPAPMSVWLPAFADALGAPRPKRVAGWVRSLRHDRGVTRWLESMRGASNTRARAELGWAPRYPSWREGFVSGLW